MTYPKLLVALMVLLAILFSHELSAQNAILFQLPSSEAQIKAATSVGDLKAVEQYKRSDNQIKHAIFKNFKANFNYCPVHFFGSEDYELVKSGKLTEVTFYDNNGVQVVIPNNLQNYEVANISFFPKIMNKVIIGGQEVLEETAEDHFGLGIILYDKKLIPLRGIMRFSPCKIYRRGSIFKNKKRYYEFRGAQIFNKKLLKHGHRIKSTQ